MLKRGGKKGPTADLAPEVERYLTALSKAALIDILHDALELQQGDGARASIETTRAFCAPRLSVRGDREPAPK